MWAVKGLLGSKQEYGRQHGISDNTEMNENRAQWRPVKKKNEGK
jgi:hypothetical protein